ASLRTDTKNPRNLAASRVSSRPLRTEWSMYLCSHTQKRFAPCLVSDEGASPRENDGACAWYLYRSPGCWPSDRAPCRSAADVGAPTRVSVQPRVRQQKGKRPEVGRA